nr:PREDICTED: ligand-dependent corepressor isoform X2 [Latimeria chalumnae]|eukprot:XP_014351254.1 PREDICTED: ligand-dependent corepressor isoform X2 [Latimeria chalumnae]
MQRMIRQFAAEYTSKNSSTQDSNQPISTKDQSLPKASPLATTPTAASAQNPVLSKLLMADQDTPLDLTVKKSQSEPSGQDGVLDLSTKRSPSAGSASLSHSPGCSSTLGNGEKAAQGKEAARSSHSPSSLEHFIARLCTHHQKQFICMLNVLCTEVKPHTEGSELEKMDAPNCGPDCNLKSTEAPGSHCSNCSGVQVNNSLDLEASGVPSTTCQHSDGSSFSHRTERSPTHVEEEEEKFSTAGEDDSSRLQIEHSSNTTVGSSIPNSSTAALNIQPVNSEESKSLGQGETLKLEVDLSSKKCQEKGTTPGTNIKEKMVNCISEEENVGNLNVSQAQKNPLKALPEDVREAELCNTADKENALQCSSKATFQDNLDNSEQDGRTVQDYVHSLGGIKVANHLHHGDNFSAENTKDGLLCRSPSSIRKTSNGLSRVKTTPASIKSTRKSKRLSRVKVRSSTSTFHQFVNDHDNQCDIVYISQPITECHFETRKSILSSRKTARKSTRGHLCNDNYWELPTVRTLARSLNVAGKGSCPALITDPSILITPKQLLTLPDSLPGLEVPVAANAEESTGDTTPLKGTPPNGELKDSATYAANETDLVVETSQTDQLQTTEGSCQPLVTLLPPPVKQNIQQEPELTESSALLQTVASGSFSEVKENVQTIEQPEEVNGVSPYVPDSCIESASGHNPEESPNTRLSAEPEFPLVATEMETSPSLQPEGDLQPASTCAHTGASDSSGVEAETVVTKKEELNADDDCENIPASPHLKETVEEIQDETIEQAPENKMEDDLHIDEVHTSASLEKKKRCRKIFDSSDRCLRSQQSQAEEREFDDSEKKKIVPSSSLLLPFLHVNLTKNPGAKRFKREVSVDEARNVNFPIDCFHKTLLEKMRDPVSRLEDAPDESSTEDDVNEENVVTTRGTYKSMLAKELELEGEDLFGSLNYAVNHCKQNGLTISFDANSEERTLYLPGENHTVSLQGTENKATDSHAKLLVKSSKTHTGYLRNKRHLATNFVAESSQIPFKGGVKPMTSKTLLRHKKLALRSYNFRHTHLVLGEESSCTNAKPQKHLDFENEDFDPFGLKDIDAARDDRPKFLECCLEEENQELIANFNAKYVKVHKGWIQLEKENPPVQKAKSKSDKLKEIWKSKKRARKCRSTYEVQKLSPVQRLFMKKFNLSNICRWFLETTETKSLVIVKKINTRIPGDIQSTKAPLQKYSSLAIDPSSQAERLKKHLKKFAVASPAKSTWKSPKLWAKAKEKEDNNRTESRLDESASTSTKTDHSTESKVKDLRRHNSVKNPAGARILRKYSNIRDKLRTQHQINKKEKTSPSSSQTEKGSKSVCINSLLSPKLASQPKLDDSCSKPALVEAEIKGRGRKKLQEEIVAVRPERRKRINADTSLTNADQNPSSKDKLLRRTRRGKNTDLTGKSPVLRRRTPVGATGSASKKTGPRGAKVKNSIKKPKGKPPVKKRVKSRSLKQNAAASKKVTKSSKQRTTVGSSRKPQKGSGKGKGKGKGKQNMVKTLTRSKRKNVGSTKMRAPLKRKVTEKLGPTPNKRRRVDSK